MMSPVVSVIIPAYNCARFISETLESVIQQTFADFEVLIVNDGSTDNLESIAKKFVARDGRIKYIRQENQGVSVARNNGFKSARGSLIAFLDADDVWLADNLQAKVERFHFDDVGLVHSDAIVIDEFSIKTSSRLTGMEGNLLDALLHWDGTQIPGPSSILVRREVLETVGVFDEDMSTTADKDLFIRIATRFRIGRVDRVTWLYRVHGNNMHRNLLVMEKDVLRLYRKAQDSKMFRNKAFEKKCFSVMYLILAASWAGDGKNISRGFLFFIRAVKSDPLIIFNVLSKTLNRWVRK